MMLRSHYPALGAACFIALFGSGASAQGATASASGVVRTADGAAISEAVVLVGRRSTITDSLGRYHIDSLDAGSIRIRVRRFGFTGVDSAFTARTGERIRWDVALKKDDFFKNVERELAEAGAKDAASGHIDSIASRLVRPDTNGVLSFGPFGSRLFATVVAQRGADSNTVLSPLSAGLALSLVRFGARSATARELDRVLALPFDQQTLERRGVDVMAALSNRTDVTLELSNAIWVDTTAIPTPAFRESTNRWRAGMATLPLATPAAVATINRWADSVTHGKIASIIDKPLPDTTRLFIANAVYFKGKWLDPFEKSATQPGDFILPSGKRITVPRMDRVASIAYRRESGYQSIRLPYRTGKVAMYIVLPDSGVPFDAVARRLAAGPLVPSTSPFEVRTVHVVLPRFHSELTTELGDPLKALGLRLAFDCDSADFTGMARATLASRAMRLCIGSAIQKTYIDVDEEGTEAAAVTGIAMVTVTSAGPPPIQFIIDRPFLFVLRDEVTGTDLFVGRIAQP